MKTRREKSQLSFVCFGFDDVPCGIEDLGEQIDRLVE
jgi:hypothetical protein